MNIIANILMGTSLALLFAISLGATVKVAKILGKGLALPQRCGKMGK